MKIVKANEMQKMDKRTIESYGIPGIVLMENAGLGATHFLLDEIENIKDKKVVVIAGRGNNGGDGFVIARYLKNKGVNVKVYVLAQKEKISGDAKFNLDLLAPLKVTVDEILSKDDLTKKKTEFYHADVIIDAIFGTGLNSDVRGHYKDVIEFVNSISKKVFSVDIPSGVNSDTGEILGVSIKADYTATFAFAKYGHFIYPGKELTGKLKIIEIGIPEFIVNEEDPKARVVYPKRIKAVLKRREKEAHKGTTGHLLAVGGSTGKTGAIIMTSKAAARVGAGLITTCVPESLANDTDSAFIEAMSFPLEEDKGFIKGFDKKLVRLLKGKKCIAVGPGMGVTEGTKELVYKIIKESDIPVVIDADGINAVSENIDILKEKKSDIILTPHPGEMSRLTGKETKEIKKDRVKTALEFAEEHGVYLVLKGAATIVATPYGRIFINSSGNEGMASGGMGDVLTGITAGLIAQGYGITDSVITAVFLHGYCADIIQAEGKPFGYLATDIIEKIPETLGKLIHG